jgi:uncharacterized membrane-anchored protein YhcB (DUF1043 family)
MPEGTPVVATLIIGLAVSVFSGLLVAILKRKWSIQDKKMNVFEDMEDKLEELRKSIWRVNKTVLIMAKILDENTEKNHPELNTNLEDIATELLGDDSGKPNKS